MNNLEKLSMTLRHNPVLEQADWLWNSIRPHYNKVISVLGRHGLERIINGTDRFLVLPEFRGVPETYEPEVWQHLMSQVKPGDIIADVGAYIGLYTIALAQRVGSGGKIFAFEPDPINFDVLKRQIELNQLEERVNLVQAAVGASDGTVSFHMGRSCQSAISSFSSVETQAVECVCLDSIFLNQRLDILKIDVEGYEEFVLKGARNLLQDKFRSPRLLYIEAHVFAWSEVGTSWESLLKFLNECDYQVFGLNAKPEEINHWGEVIAQKVT